jgi:hypothetical protein
MAPPNLFERVLRSLFSGAGEGDPPAERQLVADLVEMVVETVEPRVRQVSRYNDKLQGSMRATIAHLRALGKALAEPLPLTRKAWAGDPRVNAFFATTDDVTACLGRSRELRAFFENPANAGVEEAFALLGMKKTERRIFAPSLEGDALRHDVAQTSVSFSDHRIVAPSRTEAETRLEVGRRVINRLAQAALSRIIALDEKATELQQHKAYLGARLRLLNLSRDGVHEDQAAVGEQIKAIERELKETVEGYIEAKGSIATIEGHLEQIKAVFDHPGDHVALTHTPLRVSRLGIKLDESATESANDLVLAELSIGENFRPAIVVVRCPRAELPPKEDLIAKAERYL